MDYILTHHAKKRLLIPEKLIKDALRNPTKISYDNKRMIMIKKLNIGYYMLNEIPSF